MNNNNDGLKAIDIMRFEYITLYKLLKFLTIKLILVVYIEAFQMNN